MLRMIRYINRSLSRQIIAVVLAFLLPLLALTAWVTIRSETQRMEGEILKTGELAAKSGAHAIEALIQVSVDQNMFKVEDYMLEWPKGYTPIESGTKDQRYAVKYTEYAKAYFVDVEDAILAANPGVLFASAIDYNGHVPATNSVQAQPARPGEDEWNDLHAKQGMVYITNLHLTAGRSLDPLTVQPYHRKTGEDCWDIAAPINFHDHGKIYHYGAFRVGITRISIAQRQAFIVKQFIVLFSVLIVFVSILLYLFVRRFTQPLVAMISTVQAFSIAEDVNELKAINIDGLEYLRGMKNEVGQLWKALRLLCNSLVAAMTRLAFQDESPTKPGIDSEVKPRAGTSTDIPRR